MKKKRTQERIGSIELAKGPALCPGVPRGLGILILALLLPILACETGHPLAKESANLTEDFAGNRALRIDGYNEANSVLRLIYRKLPETTLYCQCSFDPNSKYSSGACPFRPRDSSDQRERHKVHWEHIVPASRLGKSRTCWQDAICHRKDGKPYGGRSCCRKKDRLFRAMESDLHNLRPAIGEINRHRQDYNFGDISGERREYGPCDMEISSENDLAEPPESARGPIARSYLYIESAYGIRLTAAERSQYIKWHRKYPPEAPEIARDLLIRELQGNSNPYIHGYDQTNLLDSRSKNPDKEGHSAEPPPNPGSCLLL